MTILNGYCTLDELKRELAIESQDVLDDAVLEDAIEDASRAVDAYCGRQFFAEAASCSYDVPDSGDPVLWLDNDWLAVSAVTNGDGSAVAASSYDVLPKNSPVKFAVRLKDSSGLYWTGTAGGDAIGAITVAGSLGYCNRAASDAKNVQVATATKRAALITAIGYYRKRTGQDVQAATVTGAGVVITPQGIARDAAQLLEGLRRYV